MPTNTIVLIIVTALAVLALAGVLVWVTYKTRASPRHPTVMAIRDEAGKKVRRRPRQQTLADEFASTMHSGQVEIDIKTVRAQDMS